MTRDSMHDSWRQTRHLSSKSFVRESFVSRTHARCISQSCSWGPAIAKHSGKSTCRLNRYLLSRTGQQLDTRFQLQEMHSIAIRSYMILFLKVSYNGSRKINTEYKSQHLCLEETVYKRYRWNTKKKGNMPYPK